MGIHYSSSDIHGRDHGHSDLPMDYINRMLDRYSRSPRRQQRNHHSSPPPPPAASPQTSPRRKRQSSTHRHQKRKHHRHKMTSFTGPWSDDLDALKKAVQSMPDQYKSSFSSASKEVLERVCDPDVLHVWESDSDIDNLLQLTSIIAKLCNLGTRKERGANSSDGSMIIIAEEKSGRNNFARICQLVEYLTCANRKKHLEGTVVAFGSIVVVRGWNNSVRSDNAGRDVESTVKRINIAIERVFKMGNFPPGKKKIVWHHGPVVHFLLTWTNSTTSPLRSALHAVTITGSLNLTDSIKPSSAGRSNTLPDLTCLESYAKKLEIPVLFLDSDSQAITFGYLSTYMYYYAYYINTFVPASLSRPHLYKAQDELITFAFQILGASRSKYGDSVVRLVQQHLDPRKAKKWAKTCVDPRSFDKSKCRNAGNEDVIHRAVQLADGPFSKFSPGGLPAFSRLAVGPAAAGSTEYHTAAPVDISFSSSRMRPTNPATFHIIIPSASQNLEKVTNHIQGLMMAVLERVRQEKGNPTLGDEEKESWNVATKACDWALNESKGKMPKSVEDKVKFVREKLFKGTWATVMSGGKNEGTTGPRGDMSDAARVNAEAVKAYGAGGNQYGQPAGYTQPQMGYAGHPQVQNMGYAPQQGMTMPLTSPDMGQPMPQRGMFAPPNQGYGVPSNQGFDVNPQQGYRPARMVDAGYTQVQGIGAGRYAGPPPPVRQLSRGGGRGYM